MQQFLKISDAFFKPVFFAIAALGLVAIGTVFSQTQGDWVYLGKGEFSEEAYYSRKSVAPENDLVFVRSVLNVEIGSELAGESENFRSKVTFFVIDCTRWVAVFGPSIDYAEPFGEGRILSSSLTKKASEDDIHPINPNHLLDKLAKTICISKNLK